MNKDNEKELPNDSKEETPVNMISIQQAAIILAVHPNTIRNYIEKGFLKPFELPTGKKIYLIEKDVRGLIQEKQPLHG